MSNDMFIIGGFLFLFIGIGFLIPFINQEFDTSYSESDAISLDESSEDQLTSVSGWKILASVGGMFFYTFGILPTWIDMIFIVLRLVFWTTVARNIWIGGGG